MRGRVISSGASLSWCLADALGGRDLCPGQCRASFTVGLRRRLRSAGALPRAVHRGRQGDRESALHELPSGERPSDPRQQHAPAPAPGHARHRRRRRARQHLRRLPHGPQRPDFRRPADVLPVYAGTSALGPGADRNGVGGQVEAKSAARSRTRSATEGAISRCYTSIWRTTISSAGRGSRVPVATLRPDPGAAGRVGPGLDRQRRRVSVGRFQ
jgi:hypothetical protein